MTNNQLIYAGIGARQTPKNILQLMYQIATLLAFDGYKLKTGAALGADQTFAEGATATNGKVTLCVPWQNYENAWIQQKAPNSDVITLNPAFHTQAMASVEAFHPTAANLKQAVIKLHARNYLIIENTNFVLCWTPGGKTTGGTGQGIRIANYLGIQVHNLGNQQTYTTWNNWVQQRYKQ